MNPFKNKEQQTDLEFFSVFDTKSSSYRPPVFSLNKWTLLRELTNVMKQNPNHEFNTNSEDFQVFKVGSFSFKTGEIIQQKPEHISNLHEIKASFSQGH